MEIINEVVKEITSISDVVKIYKNNLSLYEVTIELNTTCNWKCKHCYIPQHNDNGLNTSKILDMLNELKEMGVFEVTFTGGEIFCRNDIMHIIEYARNLGFCVNLFTNASLLNEEIISKLYDLNISLLSVSLFSMVSEDHDEITQVKGSHKLAVENILLASKIGLNLEVKCTIMKDNYKTYRTLIEFCKENDILFKSDVKIHTLSNGDKKSQDYMLDNRELCNVLLDVDSLNGFEAIKKKDDSHICEQMTCSLGIDCKGNIYACSRLVKVIGNIHEDSLKEIWNNSKELNYYRNLTWRNLKECKSCEISNYCVFCPGSALLENGDLLGKATSCCKLANIRKNIYSNN